MQFTTPSPPGHSIIINRDTQTPKTVIIFLVLGFRANGFQVLNMKLNLLKSKQVFEVSVEFNLKIIFLVTLFIKILSSNRVIQRMRGCVSRLNRANTYREFQLHQIPGVIVLGCHRLLYFMTMCVRDGSDKRCGRYYYDDDDCTK